MTRPRAPASAAAPERTTLPMPPVGPHASPAWGEPRATLPVGDELLTRPVLPFVVPVDRERRTEIPPPPASGVRAVPVTRLPPPARVRGPLPWRLYTALALVALVAYAVALAELTMRRAASVPVEAAEPGVPAAAAALPELLEVAPVPTSTTAPPAPAAASVAPAPRTAPIRPKAPRAAPPLASSGPKRPPLAFAPEPDATKSKRPALPFGGPDDPLRSLEH